ncbi:MAG TPA: hypothetical protein VLT45_32160 [Kofleriaceae bacterium]|nr:hypothetical protein [Kofleriaceae bacterium]
MQRDHEDIDRAFAAMVDPATEPNEMIWLLECARLAMAVHSAAELKVMDSLARRRDVSPMSPIFELLAMQSRQEHAAQRAAADDLTTVRPATIRWYDKAFEVRATAAEHAGRADHLRWTLLDHVPADVRAAAAAEYATERMRVLASSSPHAIARRREERASSE